MTPWKTYRDGVVPCLAETLRRTVRITLPAGCTVEEIPDAWQGEAPQGKASLTYRREGNDVIYESEISTNAGFLDKKNYEAQRAWAQKIEDADRRPIVVRFAAAK
jgi:cellulose synthase operon protein C